MSEVFTCQKSSVNCLYITIVELSRSERVPESAVVQLPALSEAMFRSGLCLCPVEF